MKVLLRLALVATVLACGASAAGPAPAPAPVAVATESAPSQPGERITEAAGAVVQVGSFGFGLVPDSDPGTRYAPTQELAEELRRDGLRVVFSGVVEESPRGARLWGIPLRVTAIRRLKD
jgi:hypothetical protein